MKPTIVVVNGERDWHAQFPEAAVVYGRLQDCAWVLRDGELWYVDRETAVRKANVDTRKYRVIEPPEILIGHTRAAMLHLRADALALDFLEQDDGRFVALESNDTPGLSGFPDEVRVELADCLKRRM